MEKKIQKIVLSPEVELRSFRYCVKLQGFPPTTFPAHQPQQEILIKKQIIMIKQFTSRSEGKIKIFIPTKPSSLPEHLATKKKPIDVDN